MEKTIRKVGISTLPCTIVGGFLDSENGDKTIVPGDWRKAAQENGVGALTNMQQFGGNRYKFQADGTSSAYGDYFNGEGVVEWQTRHV